MITESKVLILQMLLKKTEKRGILLKTTTFACQNVVSCHGTIK